MLAATSAFSVLCTLTVQAYDRERKLKQLKEAAALFDDPTPQPLSRTVSCSQTKKKRKLIRLNEFGVPAGHTELEDIPEKHADEEEEYDEDIINEQLARNRVFFGEEGLRKIRESFVVVIGCGGVGSWAATMLVRSGVGRIRIVDFDQVTLSSLNRHASATLEDVGTPKVESLKKYLAKIAPWVKVEAVVDLWTKDTASELLSGAPAMVVDAIDNIDTKVDLLEFCYRQGLPVISAMGAGCKADPTRVQIDDISGSAEDPLARATRRRLRIRGIVTGITVVYSSEKPGPEKASLLPLDEVTFKQGKVEELGVLQDFRARILPVLGTMPGIFGLTLATHILTRIGEYPVGEYIATKNRVKTYDTLLHHLSGQRTRVEGVQVVPFDIDDIGYMVEEVFRGRSVISRETGAGRIALSKWRAGGGWNMQNVVLMTREEMKKHETRVLKGGENVEDVYPASVLELVERRFAEERSYAKYRE